MKYKTKQHPLVTFYKAAKCAIRALQWKRLNLASSMYTGHIINKGRAY